MSQKSQALSVPGILMMVKVKDKVQTVAVRRCQTTAILISREGSGLSSEGEADRLLGERSPAVSTNTKDMAKHGSILYCSSQSPRMLPSLEWQLVGLQKGEMEGLEKGAVGYGAAGTSNFSLIMLPAPAGRVGEDRGTGGSWAHPQEGGLQSKL